MKVYIDIVFFTNFLFDFILLLSVNIILKRNMKIYRIILGALTGTLTLLMLFIRMNSLTLFLYKLVISIIMVLITFDYKTIKYTFKNLYFLYIVSIIMGGFLYFINNQINVKNEGLIFITSNFSLNLILGIILSSIFIYFYIKETKDLKENYNKYHKLTLYINDVTLNINAFLDTGNKLKDPYFHKPIILVNSSLIDDHIKTFLVPYYTVNNKDLLEVFSPQKILVNNKKTKKALIGLSDVNINGIKIILNKEILWES